MFNHCMPVMGILLFFTNCGADLICKQKVSLYYLDAAVDLISKAKHNFPLRDKCAHNSLNALDCSELLEMGYKENGVYTILPQSRVAGEKPLEVYCDMKTDGGGWTLIQRRGAFGTAVDYFFKDWKSYKEGFGDILEEFWLGNDNIFALTNQRPYSARFDLQDTENDTRYAQYDTFWIDDEYNKYRLHIDGYSGDAGDSMKIHNGHKFTTKDQDNDQSPSNCAASYKSAWWYHNCYYSGAHLNGLNMQGKTDNNTNSISWYSWKGYFDSMQSTEIKIRPMNFKLSHASLNHTPM